MIFTPWVVAPLRGAVLYSWLLAGTTGANALQDPAAPAESVPSSQQPHAGDGESGTDVAPAIDDPTLSELRTGRATLAQHVFESVSKLHEQNLTPVDSVLESSNDLLEAELDLAKDQDEKVSCYESALDRLREIMTREELLLKNNPGDDTRLLRSQLALVSTKVAQKKVKDGEILGQLAPQGVLTLKLVSASEEEKNSKQIEILAEFVTADESEESAPNGDSAKESSEENQNQVQVVEVSTEGDESKPGSEPETVEPEASHAGQIVISDLRIEGLVLGSTKVDSDESSRLQERKRSANSHFFRAVDEEDLSQATNGKLNEIHPFPFGSETGLYAVVNYLKEATQDDQFPSGIPIYLDETSLRAHELTPEDLTVKLALEGVALKTSLRLALKQIGLVYIVKEGVLIISHPESESLLDEIERQP